MKLGVVIDGADTFIRDFIVDWENNYCVDVFSYRAFKSPPFPGRLNHLIKKLTIKRFLLNHDVVFFEWSGSLLILASKLKTETKIITRLHSWELFEFAPYINWEKIDCIVLVGYAMQRWFEKQFPLEAHKVSVIYNGVRADKFVPNYNNNGGTIGMLGSLLPIKRVYETVLALYELRSQGYDFTLLLGGAPPKIGADDLRYYAALKNLVNVLKLEDHVVFCDAIENPEEFLGKLDIFISNSFWESQHVALTEAMTMGCYCLGHRWDGIEDILPEENIYITNAELVKKITNYWGKREEEKISERKILHDTAQKKFDINMLKPKMRELIEKGKTNPNKFLGN